MFALRTWSARINGPPDARTMKLLAVEKRSSIRNRQPRMKVQVDTEDAKGSGRRGGVSRSGVIGHGGEAPVLQRLRPPAGQSGVGRRREPHGAEDGPHVLLLLVMLGKLPVKGDGFSGKLGQIFGAAVSATGRRRRRKVRLWDLVAQISTPAPLLYLFIYESFTE